MKTRVSTYPLRLPISLKNAVAEASHQDNSSINQFVVVAVAAKISAMKTAEFFAERRSNADLEAAISILSRDGGQLPAPEDQPPDPDMQGTT